MPEIKNVRLLRFEDFEKYENKVPDMVERVNNHAKNGDLMLVLKDGYELEYWCEDRSLCCKGTGMLEMRISGFPGYYYRNFLVPDTPGIFVPRGQVDIHTVIINQGCVLS